MNNHPTAADDKLEEAYRRGWNDREADFLVGAERVSAQPHKGEGLRVVAVELLEEIRDLLTERVHGNPARSPGHNARLLVERLIEQAAPAPASGGVRTNHWEGSASPAEAGSDGQAAKVPASQGGLK